MNGTPSLEEDYEEIPSNYKRIIRSEIDEEMKSAEAFMSTADNKTVLVKRINMCFDEIDKALCTDVPVKSILLKNLFMYTKTLYAHLTKYSKEYYEKDIMQATVDCY